MRRKLAMVVPGLAVIALALSGCAGGGSEPPAGGGDDTPIEIAWNTQPAALDTIIDNSTAARDISQNIYEGLFAVDESGVPQPMLVESYEVNDDFTEYTFKLREGVLFHNGDEMTSADVVASFERWMSDSAVGGANFEGVTVSADGDYVVKAVSDASFFNLISLTVPPNQGLVIVPEESLQNLGETGMAEDQLIGTGPYKLGEWVKDQYILLEVFDDYQSLDTPSSGLSGAKHPTHDLKYSIVSDASTRVNGLTTGAYDFIANVHPDKVSEIENGGYIPWIDYNIQYYFVTNKQAGVFTSAEARQALYSAVDPAPIMHSAFGGDKFYRLNGAISSPSEIGWHTEAGLEGRYDSFDPEKALAGFQAAGYSGEPIRILTTRDYSDSYDGAVVLEQQLKEVGLEVELIVTDQATQLTNRQDPAIWDIFIIGTPFGPPETMRMLNPSFPGWTDSPELVQAVADVRASTSDEDAFAARESIQQNFYDYGLAVKVGDGAAVHAYNPDLTGFQKAYGLVMWNIGWSG